MCATYSTCFALMPSNLTYVMFGKQNIMWHEKYVGRKIESNGMSVRSLFVSIWFTCVSRRLLVLGQRQNINTNTKQYNNWLIFPKENREKCQDGWNISRIPYALLWNCNSIFGDKRKLTFLFSVCSLLPLNL